MSERPTLCLHKSDSGEIKLDSDAEEEKQNDEGRKLYNELLLKMHSWAQLLKEVEESSADAVNTLNELLSYIKIQQKTMAIEKECLPAWDIISSSVKPFNIQARYETLLPTSVTAVHASITPSIFRRERNLEIDMQLEPFTNPQSGNLRGDSILLLTILQFFFNDLLLIELSPFW